MNRSKLEKAINSLNVPKGLQEALGTKEFAYIPLDQIEILPQIRDSIDTESDAFKALKTSISKEGLLEPVLVIPEKDHYRLISGHRRFLAVKELQLPSIACRIINKKLSPVETLTIQLIENLQRQDLDPIEEARAYLNIYNMYTGRNLNDFINDLMLYKLSPDRLDSTVVPIIGTIKEISGKSISYIQNTVLLLTLPESIKEAIKKERLPVTAGYKLAYKREHPEFEAVCKRVLESESLTVKEIDALFRKTTKREVNKRLSLTIPSYLKAFINSPEEIIETFIKHYPKKTIKAKFKNLKGSNVLLSVNNIKVTISNKEAIKLIKTRLKDTHWDGTVILHIDGKIS